MTDKPAAPKEEKCPACWSTVPEIRLELKMHGTVAHEHWMQCFHPWHSGELRAKINSLIQSYLSRPDVQQSEITMQVLNCLAGDIEVLHD